MATTSVGVPSGGWVRVELLRVPDCPLAARVHALLHRCLDEAGIPAVVQDLEGRYPSPTLLIDGVDVVTGKAPSPGACCRLDLPTRRQVLDALHRSRS